MMREILGGITETRRKLEDNGLLLIHVNSRLGSMDERLEYMQRDLGEIKSRLPISIGFVPWLLAGIFLILGDSTYDWVGAIASWF
jgi:hypothetical protein